ncbi:hypothetical protein N7481_006614 [Penicillium waksmanii]|uniref:uncharacterized protein n=1 Tax=Penicillium waksmanii TaxID=69791 RepID=UPI002547BDE8|nr:uncharacterized protein N7481_006614 [Penicillium waksmanii]KAJ5984515.1 hypothetical protein N7481_006614 [Penicillium waksmanii]
MSGDKYPVEGQEMSPSKREIQPSAGGKAAPEKDAVARIELNTREEPNATETSASSSGTSLLGALWSPFSSLLKGTTDQNQNQESGTNQTSDQNGKLPGRIQSPEVTLVGNSEGDTMAKTAANTGNKNARKPVQATTPTEEETSPPEAYYAPNEVPLFKKLQKKRLSGTRTKQLLRAASRAHDDPPPPPELGTCCGSSCDPCVNDIWKEERDVWRERWGDRAVEGDGKRKELEW